MGPDPIYLGGRGGEWRTTQKNVGSFFFKKKEIKIKIKNKKEEREAMMAQAVHYYKKPIRRLRKERVDPEMEQRILKCLRQAPKGDSVGLTTWLSANEMAEEFGVARSRVNPSLYRMEQSNLVVQKTRDHFPKRVWAACPLQGAPTQTPILVPVVGSTNIRPVMEHCLYEFPPLRSWCQQHRHADRHVLISSVQPLDRKTGEEWVALEKGQNASDYMMSYMTTVLHKHAEACHRFVVISDDPIWRDEVWEKSIVRMLWQISGHELICVGVPDL